MIEFRFEAKEELVEEMINPIVDALTSFGATHKCVYQVNLALEEVLVNVAKYAYKDGNGMIDIAYEINENKLKVVIKDKGTAFNPLNKEDPDLTASIDERQIGGLGIYLLKKMVDELKYQRKDNENILEITKIIELEEKQ